MDPAAYRDRLLELPPNRVWRTYLGGRTLDQIAGLENPADGHSPEDWVGSLTRAVNPGRASMVEGVSCVRIGETTASLSELLAADPVYFLGRAHVEAFGPDPRLLVKLLDPSIRLHLQVHPTAAFARRFLQSPSGKAEAYHILQSRADQDDPHVYIGFRRAVDKATLRDWIIRQDIEALKDALHRLSVRPGDTLFVPGGCPHALGQGLLLVEIQEPTDWVVRFEFERGGYTLPEEARFMGRGLDFCLDVFDRRTTDLAALRRSIARIPAEPPPPGQSCTRKLLIGPVTTPCFRVSQTVLHARTAFQNEGFHIGIVTAGSVEIAIGPHRTTLRRFDKFLMPAGITGYSINPTEEHASILECRPPLPGPPLHPADKK